MSAAWKDIAPIGVRLRLDLIAVWNRENANAVRVNRGRAAREVAAGHDAAYRARRATS